MFFCLGKKVLELVLLSIIAETVIKKAIFFFFEHSMSEDEDVNFPRMAPIMIFFYIYHF